MSLCQHPRIKSESKKKKFWISIYIVLYIYKNLMKNFAKFAKVYAENIANFAFFFFNFAINFSWLYEKIYIGNFSVNPRLYRWTFFAHWKLVSILEKFVTICINSNNKTLYSTKKISRKKSLWCTVKFRYSKKKSKSW